MALVAYRVASRLYRPAKSLPVICPAFTSGTRGWASRPDQPVHGITVSDPRLGQNELPVSPALLKLLNEAGQESERDILGKLRESLSSDKGDDLEDPKVRLEIERALRLLSETLNLSAALANDGVEMYHSLTEADVAALMSLREALNERYSGPNELTVNTAAPGQLPWEVLDVDESRGLVQWGVDLTQGRAGVAPWRAAALSHSTKREMARLHFEQGVPAAALAREFGVREQRVLAILALQELERGALGKAGPQRAQAALEAVDAADAAAAPAAGVGISGGGERHAVSLPSFPNYHAVDLQAFAARLEAAAGKPLDQITDDDLTPAVAREAVGLENHAAVEARLEETEEARLVAEFRDRLAFNLGKSGRGLQRAGNRNRHMRRPKKGWNLVVKPLREQRGREVYVATPEGEGRPLSDDERLLLDRQTPKPRRRIL